MNQATADDFSPLKMRTGMPGLDTNQLIEERREKLRALRSQGAVFPNDFKPTHKADDLLKNFGHIEKDELREKNLNVCVAGRMMLKRVMGKASFATLQDDSLGLSNGQIQIYLGADFIGVECHEAFKHWDLGDIVGCEGTLFKTKTGELSVHATTVRLLTKALRPMPDKFHGVADQELKYRQRYVDLMTDIETRRRFVLRSKAVSSMRNFMLEHAFLEVETPMLQPIPGGANAKPFQTHHNALDQEMFLRIAPELYLKRLVVGGFERVFEINRNFRNEGISVRHNPEFTMMEFYAAYWNYRDLMEFTQDLIRYVANATLGTLTFHYTHQTQNKEVDLSAPFERITIREAIVKYTDASDNVDNKDWLIARLKKLGVDNAKNNLSSLSTSALQILFFEEQVEEQLWQPTFVMNHPTEISPLARASDADPTITERFELYITGREFGNGFSELNDPEEQANRFLNQVKAKDAGDDEAMYFDHDFVRALEYGLPPTAGCGIGVDRLMMLLTNSASIRDIILFPALKRES